jgi:hypothetical protein
LLNRYQKSIDAWNSGLARAFINADPARNFSMAVTPSWLESPNMATVSGVYALPASQYPDPFGSADPEGGVPTSTTYANFHGVPSKSYALSGSLSSALQVGGQAPYAGVLSG